MLAFITGKKKNRSPSLTAIAFLLILFHAAANFTRKYRPAVRRAEVAPVNSMSSGTDMFD